MRERGSKGGREGRREEGKEGGSNNLMLKFHLVYIIMDVAFLEK